jgi:branched-chain amino acid transport system substrate-binding protein
MLRRMRLGVIFGVALLGLLPESASAEIRIGLAAPLSGRQAAQGLAMQSALVAAVAEVNAGGGVRGEPLVLDVEDDGCARATGEGAARALGARAPLIVIGHPCSSAATVAAPIYAAAKVLFIAVGPRHTDVTQGGLTSPILRLAGRDDRQGDAAARWLLAHAPSRRVAIVQDRTAYARAIAERTASVLKDAAAELATVFPIVAGKQSYADTIARVGEMKAEALFFAGYPDEAAVLLADLTAAGLKIPVLGSDALATDEFALVAAKSKLSLQVLLPAEPRPVEHDADAAGARARGALEIWLQMVSATGTTNGEALARKARDPLVEINTPSLGRLRFDQEGDLAADAFVTSSARAGDWIVDPRP